jgi:hypothetical protein
MILRNKVAAASFAMFAIAGSASAFESCFNTGWVSKVNAGVETAVQCPDGTYLKGLIFTHPNGQNLTYQESVAAQCCSEQLVYPQFYTKTSWINKVNNQTVSRAPANSMVTGISFYHNRGQDLTFQEAVKVSVSYPIDFLDNMVNCYSGAWVSKAPTVSQALCSLPNSYVKTVKFFHQSGENFTFQESVAVDCCQLRTIGGGIGGDGGFDPDHGGVIRHLD